MDRGIVPVAALVTDKDLEETGAIGGSRPKAKPSVICGDHPKRPEFVGLDSPRTPRQYRAPEPEEGTPTLAEELGAVRKGLEKVAQQFARPKKIDPPAFNRNWELFTHVVQKHLEERYKCIRCQKETDRAHVSEYTDPGHPCFLNSQPFRLLELAAPYTVLGAITILRRHFHDLPEKALKPYHDRRQTGLAVKHSWPTRESYEAPVLTPRELHMKQLRDFLDDKTLTEEERRGLGLEPS